LVILAVKPCWKSVPIIIIPPDTSFPIADVGLMLVIPPEPVGEVVVTVVVDP
jgi:hypothetical protein